jgi:hypothetical protein
VFIFFLCIYTTYKQIFTVGPETRKIIYRLKMQRRYRLCKLIDM